MSWSTSELRVRLAPWNRFKPSSKIFYWPFYGGTSFVDHSCYFWCVLVILSCASFYCCLVVTCWERADLLALVCDVLLWDCYFPYFEIVTFPLVSWVRCGTWLYRFLIFARFRTLTKYTEYLNYWPKRFSLQFRLNIMILTKCNANIIGTRTETV